MNIAATKLAAGISALLMAVAPLAVARWEAVTRQSSSDQSSTVTVVPRYFDYPQPGEFLQGNFPVESPHIAATLSQSVEIAKYQVTVVEYGRCVGAGACRPADNRSASLHDEPVTGVSYLDAVAYARWYSQRSGISWRLPTDLEWATGASERFREATAKIERDPKNPASAWLSRYAFESFDPSGYGSGPMPIGTFGGNSEGIYDLSGNVWEWTSSCYRRSTLAKEGKVIGTIKNCGVHVVEGRHRTYMSNFIRDAKSGGCSVGTPPDNLGFRLVRDTSLKARLELMLDRFVRKLG